MSRDKFITRTLSLRTPEVRERAIAVLRNLPIDAENPLAVTIGEDAKPRKADQNSLMWVGTLKDISDQAYIDGRKYSDLVWHEWFKREHLPEEFNSDLCKKGYEKWGYMLSGEKVLIGSTTDLTVKGFALYLTAVEADGANMGVEFHANPNQRRA